MSNFAQATITDRIDDARDAYRAIRAIQDLMIPQSLKTQLGAIPVLDMVSRDDMSTLLGIVNGHLDRALLAADEAVRSHFSQEGQLHHKQ